MQNKDFFSFFIHEYPLKQFILSITSRVSYKNVKLKKNHV